MVLERARTPSWHGGSSVISKGASKVMVILMVAVLVTTSLLIVFQDDGVDFPEPDDSVSAVMNNYSSVSTGLPSSGDYYFLKFGDVNDDGYDDIVAGAGQYPSRDVDTEGIYVYTSKAGASWEGNSSGLPTTGNYAGLDIGDIDDDGDLDIVVGGESWSGSSVKGLLVYLNNGTVSGKLSWIAATKPDTNMYYDQVVMADINGDDDMDLIAGMRSNGIRVWKGDGGSGTSFTWTASNTGLPTSGEYTGIAVADMNKDGDMDIIATDYSSGSPEVRLYTGDGTGSWTSRQSSFPTGNAATFGVQVGDFNKDTHNDIIYARNGGLKCLLGNSGGVSQTSFTWTAANTGLPTSGSFRQVAIGDVDKDNDLDVIGAVDGGGLRLYLGNGGGGSGQNWSLVSKNLPSSSKYYGVDLGDFNKDGVVDVGGAMWDTGSSSGGLYAFKGSLQSGVPTAVGYWDGTTNTSHSVYLGDTVKMNGTQSSDTEDAPTGDPTGTLLTYEWNITSVPLGSGITDASLTPDDKRALPSLKPDVVGAYKITLAVKDTDANWSESEVTLNLEVLKPNDPPIADAGNDQTVLVGETVKLNASGSSDPDGALLAWQWTVDPTNPVVVALTDSNLPEASFVAPATVGVYTFNLTVRDDNNTWSPPDSINVTVELPANELPVAVAPVDFAVRVDEVAKLNGSASYDNDGSIVAWDWKCTSHPSLPMTNTDTEEASFTPVLPGLYNFTLTVQDDRGDWAVEDMVNVTVLSASVNVPPVAEIAGAASVDKYVGDLVTLDGSPSRDDDGTIDEYLWNCTSHPTLSFTGQNNTTVTFTAGDEGTFVFTLAVRDNNDTWSINEDSVTIIVTLPPENTLPIAVIEGPVSKVRSGGEVNLDGSRSSDREGLIVNFTWDCISHPTLNFTGQYTSSIKFIVPDIGDYTFTLDVQDEAGDWNEEPAYYTVSVKVNVPPTANISGPSRGSPGVNITLSASGSTDPDGEVVAWRWNCTSDTGLYLNGSEEEEMTFNVTAAGYYTFVLTVKDDENSWSPVVEYVINITAIDQPPMADAGADRTVRLPNSVSLNGGGSYDVDGDIVAYRWRCTSHPTVSGLVGDDQMVATFSPPDAIVFTFSLEVQDEAGQWSAPDTVVITVLNENVAPVLTIKAPKPGSVNLDVDRLRIEWEATDANGDTLMFKVEIWKAGTIFLARKGNLPYGTNNVTFNDTNYNFPRNVDLEAKVWAWETNTADRYEVEVSTGYFQIVDKTVPGTNGGGDDKEFNYTYLILAIVLIMGIILVAAMTMRGGGDEEEVPWEHDAPRTGKAAGPAPSALATKLPPVAPAVAKGPKKAAKDPKGRMLDCPDCGAPLDHDTDFGSPYCWDCDKYF